MKSCAQYLANGLRISKPCRLCPAQICSGLHKSPNTVPDHLCEDPLRDGSRHRSACARAARTARETNSTLRSHDGPAVLRRSSLRLDVLLYGCCRLKSPDSCSRGTVSRVEPLLTKSASCSCAASKHQDDQQAKGVRLDVKIVAPTKGSEQEPPPAHARPSTSSTQRSAPGWASWQRSVSGSALRTAC